MDTGTDRNRIYSAFSHPVVCVHDDVNLEHLPALEGLDDGPVDVRGAVLVGALGSILKKQRLGETEMRIR